MNFEDKGSKGKTELDALKDRVNALTRELEIQKNKIALLNDINADGLFIHDNFIIKEVNNAFAKMMEYAPEEMMGMDGRKLLSEGALEGLQKNISRGVPHLFEVKMITNSGKLIDVVTKGGSVGEGENNLRAVFVQDVTELKTTQRELELSEERHRMVSNLLSDYVYTCSILPGQPPVLGWVSGAIERISGYTAQEIDVLEGGWYSIIHPEDVGRIAASINVNYSEEKFYNNEYRIIDKSGTIRWLLDRSMCIKFDTETKETVILGATKDITERKKIEEDLRIRNEELNNFVYKVSHDLRAPLSSIKGLINLSKLEEQKGIHLPKIEERVNRLDEFIRDILSHSRNLNTELSISQIDLKQLIDQTFMELEYLPKAKFVEKRMTFRGSILYNDRVRVSEILRNLISNAIKYQDKDKDDHFVKVDVEVTKKGATILVEDNGIGVGEAYKEKIFDMFYRAAEMEEGSGIGLYIVKQAVEKLNGWVSVKSEPKKGSVFTIGIPNHSMDK